MPVELEGSIKRQTTVRDMKDGEIGILLGGRYDGEIVQLYGENNLICVGKKFGESWTGISDNNSVLSFPVRILEDGETLIYRSVK